MNIVQKIGTEWYFVFANNFYQFAIGISAFLAFAMIVWGGTRYILAAGNPGTQSDARDQVLQAVLGLVLLFGAYLILNLINPRLTSLRLPSLTAIKTVTDPRYTVPCPPSCAGTCDASGKCLVATLPSPCTPGNQEYVCGNPAVPCTRDCVHPDICMPVPGTGYYCLRESDWVPY